MDASPDEKLQSEAQADVLAFLAQPSAYAPVPEAVERIETHGAIVFLAGDFAYKVKKAVRYDYMDFSTLEKRRLDSLREFDINRPNAPEIYLDVLAVTRDGNGRLSLAGDGEPVEWLLRMRRFSQSDLLGAVAATGPLKPNLCDRLALAVHSAHTRAPAQSTLDGPQRVRDVATSLRRQLNSVGHGGAAFDLDALFDALDARLRTAAPVLDERARAGFVRRVHGDLHLDNIVLWHGAPMLFDAISFDDDLATTDTLYDLAFLLMDLCHRGQRTAANRILGRYLWHSQAALDLSGLAALPAFLALRAFVRAMVLLQRAAQTPAAEALRGNARDYLALAERVTQPPPAAIIAVGGLSGTGKSTLAATLAPAIGAAPGAVHLRSDLERKALFGVGDTDRLPADTYTPASSARVYDVLMDKAARIVRAGHVVIVDGVFATPVEQLRIAAIARQLGVPFIGLWLTAHPETMRARVASRRDDASDATVDIVDRQLTRGIASTPADWLAIDADGGPEAVARAAMACLAAGGWRLEAEMQRGPRTIA